MRRVPGGPPAGGPTRPSDGRVRDRPGRPQPRSRSGASLRGSRAPRRPGPRSSRSMLPRMDDAADEDVRARGDAAFLRQADPEIPVGVAGTAGRRSLRCAYDVGSCHDVRAAAPENVVRRAASSGASSDPRRERVRATSGLPQPQRSRVGERRPCAGRGSSWSRSFSGDQRSSSSRNASQSARAAATPAFRARATPRGTSWRMTRRRGSSSAARRSPVPSSEPSSTTTTSTSTCSWTSAERSAADDSSPHRFRVGMTTVTSG